MKIALAICTCNRPQTLQKLHESLRSADLSAAAQVILVDNHKSQNGALLWRTLPDLTAPTTILAAPDPGIAQARNAAIAEARRTGMEAIAFVDDDERVTPDWLTRLAEHQRTTKAAIVAGPVAPIFQTPPSAWAKASNFYAQTQPLYRGRPPVNSTANVLICLDAIANLDPVFDPAFGLSGGSDQILFTHLHRLGVAMAWCPDALVHEDVPAERQTRLWVRRRALRNGNINMRAALYFASPMRRLAISAVFLGLIPWLLLASAVRYIGARYLGVGFAEDAEIAACKALGRAEALKGAVVFEYKDRHLIVSGHE